MKQSGPESTGLTPSTEGKKRSMLATCSLPYQRESMCEQHQGQIRTLQSGLSTVDELKYKTQFKYINSKDSQEHFKRITDDTFRAHLFKFYTLHRKYWPARDKNSACYFSKKLTKF